MTERRSRDRPNDVLIRIRKTAICGTDMHIFNWDEWAQKTIPVPMTVGHEYVGTVEAMGDEVRGLEVGQRVSAKATSSAAIAATAARDAGTCAATRRAWA
jgi:threonine dehydrogenase-like Zn-dependent dehydrogenase